MTDRTFIWITGKSSRRVHVMNPRTEQTFCQTENVRRKKPLDGKGPEKPPGRRLCNNCLDLIERNGTNFQEPSLGVLLGERLTEEGPDLFTINVVPEPKKRQRQVRPVHQPKGQKPKRSKIKYDRPFNDDLPPWL